MARHGICEQCNRERLLVKSVCLECWPEQRRQDRAYAEGKLAATTDAANPYNHETDYCVYMAWEMGWSQAVGAAKKKKRKGK